jgi:hypothetical protein
MAIRFNLVTILSQSKGESMARQTTELQVGRLGAYVEVINDIQ